MGQREQWAIGMSGPQGGVVHREEWATGRSYPQGGVSHREEGATGRSGPQGGVDHREDLSTGRSGPQGGVSHVNVGNFQCLGHINQWDHLTTIYLSWKSSERELLEK